MPGKKRKNGVVEKEHTITNLQSKSTFTWPRRVKNCTVFFKYIIIKTI